MAKLPRELSHESHIHIGNRWYEKPIFVGLCFTLLVVVCIWIGEATTSSPRIASAASAEVVDAKPVRIAAVGDSNTDGTGVDLAERVALSYPGQLQAMLGTQYEVFNYGVSGSTLLSGTNNPYVDHEFFKNSKEANPDIVLIMLGTNDFRSEVWNVDDFKEQYAAFIAQYKKRSSTPTVYLLTPPAYFDEGNKERELRLKDEVIPAVFDVAEAENLEIIDIYEATKDQGELFPDGVHPNAKGYKMIAQAVYDKLMQ